MALFEMTMNRVAGTDPKSTALAPVKHEPWISTLTISSFAFPSLTAWFTTG